MNALFVLFLILGGFALLIVGTLRILREIEIAQVMTDGLVEHFGIPRSSALRAYLCHRLRESIFVSLLWPFSRAREALDWAITNWRWPGYRKTGAPPLFLRCVETLPPRWGRRYTCPNVAAHGAEGDTVPQVCADHKTATDVWIGPMPADTREKIAAELQAQLRGES